MALKLEREVKGVIANYWKIMSVHYSSVTNTSTIVLSLFVSEDIRLQGLNNDLTSMSFTLDGYLAMDELYSKIKESKKVLTMVTPAVTELIDPRVTDDIRNIRIVSEAVYEMKETNPFSLAEDI